MQFLKIVIAILVSALVLGFFYVLTLFSPSAYEEEFETYLDPNADAAAILKESEQLEREFEASATASSTPSQADLDKLRRAVRLQELYITRSRTFDRSPSERLMRLQKRLQNIEAQPMYQKVLELENEAKVKRQQGKYAEAADLFQKAYDIQMLLNGDYPFSNYKNITKSTDLGRQVRLMQARPVYEETLAFEEAARKAASEKRWEDARKNYEKTLESILKMNTQFPNSGYSDFLRVQRIEGELDSLKSVDLNSQILEKEKQARKFEGEGSSTLAAEAYGEAENLQRELNRVYPKSVHASDSRVSEFERKKVELASKKLADEIISQDALLRQALLEGRASDAARLSDSLLRKAESFVEHYPRNEIINSDFSMRLRYLNYISSEIGNIQKAVASNLVPIGGGASMYKTEIPQSLFKMVMQENPSRDAEDKDKPVDSVAYEDVQRFCNRLGWVLARDVRLPTLAEFKAAVGSLRYTNLNDIAWSNLNSGGKTHRVATKKANDRGFFDLLGNVSEYVLPDASNSASGDELFLVGGGAQTSSDAIMDLDIRKVDKKHRNRMGGFRVVVGPADKTPKPQAK